MRKLPLFFVLAAIFALPALAQTSVTGTSPFYPNNGSTSLEVTASTGASTAVAISPAPQVMVTNTGAQTAFIKFGGSAIAATVTGIPVVAGATKVFTLDSTMGYASAITTTSTSAVYFTGGKGN